MGATYTNTAASTAAVTNRFVVSVAMQNAAYTIANPSPVWSGGCFVTLTHTTVATTDTLGTIALVGTDLNGQAISETLTPLADSTVTSTKIYRTVTSATGAGWTQQGASADTIVMGCAAGNIALVGTGQLFGVLVNNTVATSFTISDATTTIMTVPASQAAGTYYNLHGVDILKYLKVSTTNTNDVTVFHTRTNSYSYQTS